jgi:hypothetical protein
MAVEWCAPLGSAKQAAPARAAAARVDRINEGANMASSLGGKLFAGFSALRHLASN